MKALVFQYNAIVVDKPKPPIPYNHVLVRVYAVALSALENAVYGGLLWVEPGRILGAEGYGRVEYLGVDADTSFSGRLIASLPKTERGIPGVDYDGFAAEYTAQPSSGIGLLPREVDDIVAATLASSTSIALYVAEKSRGKNILIIGSGYTGILTAYFSKQAVNIVLVGNPSKKLKGIARGFTNALYNYNKLSDIKGEWDIVFLSSLDARARMYVREIGRASTVIVHPWLELLSTSIRGLTRVEVAGWTRTGEAYYAGKQLPAELREGLIKVIDNLEAALPVTAPRVVVKLVKE